MTCPDLIHLVKLPNITLPLRRSSERVKDADVLIINKVPINENTVGTAKNLKLVCVTATGTNNLDKDYLDSHKIAWRNVAGYSTETVTQHTFAMLFYLLEKLRYYDDYVKDGNYINDTSFYSLCRTFFRNQWQDVGNHRTWRDRTPRCPNCPGIWCKCHLLFSIRRPAQDGYTQS